MLGHPRSSLRGSSSGRNKAAQLLAFFFVLLALFEATKAQPPPVCTADSQCLPNVCIGSSCVARPGPGDTCENNSQCANAVQSCIDGECANKAAPGATCDDATDCSVSGSSCPSRLCLSPTNGACSINEDCAEASDTCIDKVCKPKSEPGSVCDDTADCKSAAICFSRVCLSPEGGPCTANSHCSASFLSCIQSVCSRKASPGATCDNNDAADCSVSGSSCPSGKCLSPTNSACSSNTQCASSDDSCISSRCKNKASPGGFCDASDPADCSESGSSCPSGICLSPNGKSCSANEQCFTSGATCISGVCKAKASTGDPCDDTGDCTGSASCVSGVCRSPNGGSCSQNSDCLTSSTCISARCAARSGPGGACDESSDCVIPSSTCPSLTCLSPPGGSCSENSHCISGQTCIEGACSGKSSPGGPCGDAGDCTVKGSSCTSGACLSPFGALCFANSHCTVGLTCVDDECDVKGGPGDACDDGGDCTVSGSTCISDTCRSPSGSACGKNEDCQPSFSCFSRVCKKQSNPGAVCQDKGDCIVPGSICRDDVCKSPIGTSCSGNDQCESSACILGTCNPISDAGEACDEDSDCSVFASTCSSNICLSPTGGSCSSNNHCASSTESCIIGGCQTKANPGNYCDNNDGGDCAVLGSQCVDNECLSPSNGRCFRNGDCFVSNQVCIASTCRAPSGPGGTCDPVDAVNDCSIVGASCPINKCLSPSGGDCIANSDCAITTQSCISSKCTARKNPGEFCDDSGDCLVAGSFCVSNTCLSPTNARCSNNNQCASSSDSCISSRCRPKAAPGAVCDSTDVFDCAIPGSTCPTNVCLSPSGAPCSTNSQCATTGQVCVNSLCKSKSPPGGRCEQVSDCSVPASACISNTCRSPTNGFCFSNNNQCISASQTCINSKCRAKSSSGGQCDSGDFADCSITGSTCPSGTCVGPSGSSCTKNDQCPSGQTCLSSKCREKSPVGGLCDPSDAGDCEVPGSTCTSGVCLSPTGGSCVINTHCAASKDSCLQLYCTPKSDPGEYCDPKDESDCVIFGSTCPFERCLSPNGALCEENAQCGGPNQICVNNACRTKSAPGGVCDENDGSDCDVSGSTCPEKKCLSPSGGRCSSNTHCGSSLTCISGACRPLSFPGGPCGDVDDCVFDDSVCSANVCLSTLDGTCISDEDCVSSLVCISDVCTHPNAQ